MSSGGSNHADGKKSSAKTTPENAQGKVKKAKQKKSAVMVLEDNSESKAMVTNPPKPPEGFLPFSHNVITESFREFAFKNLNETDEVREKALKEFRDILRSDPDLVFNDEEIFLLIFLRSRKFNVKRSVDLFITGLNYIESYRYMLERTEPNILRRVIAAKMVGFLPYRDHMGRAIIYSRADAWNSDEVPAADAIFGGLIAIQSAALNPVNQITGFIVILDLKDLKIQQVFAMSRWMIFGTITLQRACPCFLKAFHVINVPPIYKIGWKLVKPLLSEKIRNRFIFHKSSDLSSLYEHIPKEILPPELGGPIPFSNDHWAWNIDNIEKGYYDHLNENYFISKRKKKASS